MGGEDRDIPMSGFCLISSLEGFFPSCVFAHEVSHCFSSARIACDLASYSERVAPSMVSLLTVKYARNKEPCTRKTVDQATSSRNWYCWTEVGRYVLLAGLRQNVSVPRRSVHATLAHLQPHFSTSLTLTRILL